MGLLKSCDAFCECSEGPTPGFSVREISSEWYIQIPLLNSHGQANISAAAPAAMLTVTNQLMFLNYRKRYFRCYLPAKRFYKVLVKKIMIFLYCRNVNGKLGVYKRRHNIKKAACYSNENTLSISKML